jgi:hypothetical protein
MKSRYADGGEIFCIPLFWLDEGYDSVNKLKLKKEDENKLFSFGRVIEDMKGCGILVEIFNATGTMSLDYEKIITSGRLFKPLFIFWLPIKKKRWKIIYKTPNYNKFNDSNFNDISVVFGSYDELYLETLSSGKKVFITEEDAKKYEQSIIWHPIDLERRIGCELGIYPCLY